MGRQQGRIGVGAAVLVALLASTGAQAQVEGQVSVQRFDPAPGQNNFVTTRGVRTEGEMVWTAAFMANYAYEPLTVTINGNSEPSVENMVTGDVYGSLTIIDELQVGLRVPVTWSDGLGLDPEGRPAQPNDAISAVAVGDIQAEVKGRFYGEADDPIALGAFVYVSAPIADQIEDRVYIGNTSPLVGGAVVADGIYGAWTYGVNVGGAWREEAQILSATLGPEMRFNAAVGYQLNPMLRLVVDTFGSTNFDFEESSTTNFEVDAAAQIVPLGSQFTFTVGGGTAAFKGIGGARARAFLGVMYDATVVDSDGDGFGDTRDACPTDPEDKDGFEDDDGCPEPDNDLDHIPDAVDKCPNEAEDLDGFEDKDGCPEPDNDQDGLEDVADLCPNKPETKNGFQDGDGCPDEKDTDEDGLPDGEDKCPEEPEDTDGFQDTDGCPDPDNDQDGIPDNLDECIELPEDGKGEGRELEDGCPIDA